MSRVGSNILIVGVPDKDDALKELPVRLFVMDTAIQAIACMKEYKIATLVSHWDLIDQPDGEFLESAVLAKPTLPTIAFIKPGDLRQEVAARSLGVSAVLNEDVDNAYFIKTVCQLLDISAVKTMRMTGQL